MNVIESTSHGPRSWIIQATNVGMEQAVKGIGVGAAYSFDFFPHIRQELHRSQADENEGPGHTMLIAAGP